LDLNADNTATPTANKGALALPRVSLASNTAQLNGTTPMTGMLVYNTNASMTGGSGVGMYYWNGSSWVGVAHYGLTPPYYVSWIRSLDTSITLTTGSLLFGSFDAPTVSSLDFCTDANSRGVMFNSGSQSVEFFAADGNPRPAWLAHVACYHPIIEN